MPTGMIRVRKSEQLDYPREEGRWREAFDHLPWKSVAILWTIEK